MGRVRLLRPNLPPIHIPDTLLQQLGVRLSFSVRRLPIAPVVVGDVVQLTDSISELDFNAQACWSQLFEHISSQVEAFALVVRDVRLQAAVVSWNLQVHEHARLFMDVRKRKQSGNVSDVKSYYIDPETLGVCAVSPEADRTVSRKVELRKMFSSLNPRYLAVAAGGCALMLCLFSFGSVGSTFALALSSGAVLIAAISLKIVS
jgi:hypothetical protein